MQELETLFLENLNIDFISGMFSNPRAKEGMKKVKMRPLQKGGQLHFQFEQYTETQVFPENLLPDAASKKAVDLLQNFRQLQLENEALRQECQTLRQSLASANARYNDLRARALKAYNGQKAQIEELQAKIGALAAQLERRKGAGSPEAEPR